MKRSDVISLYESISTLKNGELKGKALDKYIWARLALKKIHDDWVATSKEIADQTKPEGFDSASEEEKKTLQVYWDSRFSPIVEKWKKEEVEVKTKVLSFSECKALCSKNDLQGYTQDLIFTWFCKDGEPEDVQEETSVEEVE